MKNLGILILVWLLAVCCASGLGPHEVLVLANGQSADSVDIAKEFLRLRRIPEQNMVVLSLPRSVTDGQARMSPDEFARLIWQPATLAMRERGLDDHILAWIYSVDFPIMITTSPEVSIQGLTFLRNELVNHEAVRDGTYSSLLFGGPHGLNDAPHYSQTFDVYKEWLQDEMPLPSMMLGYTGENGGTRKDVIDCLARGVRADCTKPAGTVYFVTSDDVRSKCRQWQFSGAQKELHAMGINSVITDNFPVKAEDVMGMMMGAALVSPGRVSRYLPGCMAEHLTSAAAVFHAAGQTKLTDWLKAGVTASAGTVTEPMSIWTKFPNARFFAHYGAGCSMIESFFQSVRCPLQILIVGEPFSQPWAESAELTLSGLGLSMIVSGVLELSAGIKSGNDAHYGKYMVLLDGRLIGTISSIPGNMSTVFRLDTTRVDDGKHVLRVVAYRTGLVRSQIFTERIIIVNNGRGL